MLKRTKALATVISLASILATADVVKAITLKVEIRNNSPEGGVYLTPVWGGFHNGSFDSYNGGLSSQPGLERLAEDGDISQVAEDFANNLTYIDNSSGTPLSATLPSASAGLAQVGSRVQGTIGAGPIGPSGMATQVFDVAEDGSNDYFSYLSMVLPSSDYYLANGDPLAWDISSLFTDPTAEISFDIGTSGDINDAGTEINDFETSAGNGFFPGLPTGQTEGNQGAAENGVNTNVVTPFSEFANIPDGFDLTNLNFNNSELYPNGIATVTISVVPEKTPEPGTIFGLIAISGLGSFRLRHQKKLVEK